MPRGDTMNGSWIVFDDQGTAISTNGSELEALRQAVQERGTVKFVPHGMRFDAAFASDEPFLMEIDQRNDYGYDEPIPYQLDTPTPVDGKTPEELILDRITLPENHGMGPA